MTKRGQAANLQVVGILNRVPCDLVGDTGIAALNIKGAAHIGERFESAVFLVLGFVLRIVLCIVLRAILVLRFVLFVHDGTSLHKSNNSVRLEKGFILC